MASYSFSWCLETHLPSVLTYVYDSHLGGWIFFIKSLSFANSVVGTKISIAENSPFSFSSFLVSSATVSYLRLVFSYLVFLLSLLSVLFDDLSSSFLTVVVSSSSSWT